MTHLILRLLPPLCLTACVGKSTDSHTGATEDSVAIDSVDSPDSETGDPCADTARMLEILSPSEGATFLTGDAVSLLTESWVTTASWTIDGVIVAETPSATWTATAGAHTVGVTASGGECNLRPGSVGITVVDASVAVFGDDLGLAGVTWHGLSAAPDATLWASSNTGLVHLDARTDPPTVRTYTSLDGLYTDSPYGVLAHSDGTLWIGDVGDTERQGSHMRIDAEGNLALIEVVDYTESAEIQYVLRMREQPWGLGAGDVWMGTNEGVCVWDADLGVYSEHAHPTHPHGLTYGVAFTPDASIWNGDQYQVSRWEYSNDGSLSPSPMTSGGDLAEYWIPWPVGIEEPVYISDIDTDGYTLWLASTAYGVARVDVGVDVGTSTTTLLGDPFPTSASAIRADGEGHVWIGTSTGLLVWDTASETLIDLTTWLPDPAVTQITVDVATSPKVVWVGTSQGIVRFTGVP